MRALQPVDVLVDELALPEGQFFTDETMYNPRTGEPGYTIHEVARFFFGRSRIWLQKHVWGGHLLLDGKPVQIPREQGNDYLRWRLVDIERTAYALAQGGYLKVPHLQRVIGIVLLVAENYQYLLSSPRSTSVIPHSNAEVERRVRMATETVTQIKDDMDDSPGASIRRFAVEDIGYVIDLTDVNWKEFLTLLEPYIARARPDRRRRIDTPEQAVYRAQVREWAQGQSGLEVGARGRIPFSVVEAYERAHRSRKKSTP